MRISDLPSDVQQDLEATGLNRRYFIITDWMDQREGVMCEIGGEEEYGDEWKKIVTGEHPLIDCEPVEVILH